jgi:2-oxoglutarate ferredoxin oxidoreductase subunit beta
MTGGQMAPTTLPGMVTTSSPHGRDVELAGYPIRVCELVSELDGAAYVARRTATNPREIRHLKNAVRDAFRVQRAGLGYSLIEVISNCPTNWGLSPIESIQFVQDKMLPYYPLGDYKVTPEVERLLNRRD